MYGIHPKNMTRYSYGLQILTTLLIAICSEYTEEYERVLKWFRNTDKSTHTYMYGIHPKNMTRCSNSLKILTTLLITICTEFIRRTRQGAQMVSKYSQLYAQLYVRNSSEEYDKVLKWSQHTHNSTHSYIYGIHPKNMTECSNGLKILTTLLIAVCMEFTEEYDKVLKWSENTHNSTHSYMYGTQILTTLLIAVCLKFTEEHDKVL